MKAPKYRLRVPNSVASLSRNMHPDLKKKVRASLRIILSHPGSGKVLRDELEGLRSFRVSRLRIVYRISPSRHEIEIVAIGPRERTYEETYRMLRRGEKEARGK